MKYSILFSLFFFIILKTSSQTATVPVSFKTPEVDAFNRFIETPVSQYTGVPNISIPLYEIVMKGVTVPVTLDYHAGGIRVDQDATWVGLGWSLSYGGEISRKSRGLPDEYSFFSGTDSQGTSINYYMQLPNISAMPSAAVNEARYERMSDAKWDRRDYMPDEFYYAALGYSGRFMFNQTQNKFVLFPKEDIEIQKNQNVPDANFWKLKLPDGTGVEFGPSTSHDQVFRSGNKSVIDSWLVKTIKNNNNDSITYNYERFSYYLPKISGQTYRFHSTSISDPVNLNGTSFSNSQINDNKLKSISFPNGRMEFIHQSRVDMPGIALSEIRIYNINEVLIKTIKFNYSYFYGNAYDAVSLVNSGYAQSISDDYRSKRLKLDSVSIVGTGLEPINYGFNYYTSEIMPSKYTFSQDHWGFYNGIPNMSLSGLIPNMDKRFDGGDRSVKPEYTNNFSLKDITYPEGGKSEFVYENNMSGIIDAPSALLITYQDDHFLEKSAGINVSSYSRKTNYPAPDQIINDERYYRKRFTVGGAGYPVFGYGWNVSTNFGISEIEKNQIFSANNVNFMLEKINEDGTRTLIKSFNTTDPNFPYNNTQRKGTDNAIMGISTGTYEMTVKMTYIAPTNSVMDNQPYNLGFTIKWREMDATKNMIYVGGLRVKEINYYNSGNNIERKKRFTYLNPSAYPTNPAYTSGRLVSLPQYIQNRVGSHKNSYGVDEHDFITQFSSNSVLPLETTSGSYVGYEFVDEYDVDLTQPQNDLRTAYHFLFERPYFSQFYGAKNSGIIDSKEWNRGRLLDKKYYKENQVIKSEDYDYYYWSPHLQNDTDEDFIEEINTYFISFQSLMYGCSCVEPFEDDFYDMDGGVSNCVYFRYGTFDNHVVTYAGQPVLGWQFGGGISNTTCDFYTTVPYFKHYTGLNRMKSKTVTSYDNPLLPVIQKEEYTYGRTPVHYELTSTDLSASDGLMVKTELKYPQDLSLTSSAETARLKLIANHQLNVVLSKANSRNSAVLTLKTDYKIDPLTNFVLPEKVKSNTAGSSDEVRTVFHKYDSNGNVVSFSGLNGPLTCYLWSYNGQYPVAEIKNADYGEVELILGAAVLENFRKSTPDKSAIDNFIAPLKAAFPQAQISSYSYKPLVGILTMTDAKGLTFSYEYDEFQRLKNIKDHNGNIIKHIDYHYKP